MNLLSSKKQSKHRTHLIQTNIDLSFLKCFLNGLDQSIHLCLQSIIKVRFLKNLERFKTSPHGYRIARERPCLIDLPKRGKFIQNLRLSPKGCRCKATP